MKNEKVVQNKHLKNYFKRYWMVYAMLLPGVLYLTIFKYIPMYGVVMAFKDYDGIGRIFDAPWVGLANFERIFSTKAFTRALRNTIEISLLKLIIGFPMPILLALLIDSVNIKIIKRMTQTVVFLPSFISWVLVYGLFYAVFSPGTGCIQAILEFFGYQGTIPNIFAQKDTFRFAIMLTSIWHNAGSSSIIYLAALTGIDQQLYEAAAIDGAGRWRQLWHITLPGIRGTIATLLIMRVGEMMYAGFDQIFVMYNDAVKSVAEILDTYVYSIGLGQRNYSIAAAAGLFQSLIGMILVITTNKIAKKLEPDSGLF